MTDPRYWLYWAAAFLIVIAILSVGAGLHEYFQWKKDGK